MATERSEFNTLAGVTLIASALLFLLRAFLDFWAGPPPSTGNGILAWSTSNRIILSFANEAFFFAAMLLIPGIVAVYQTLASRRKAMATAGCGLFAVSIPVMVILDVVHGRLVYPIFGIHLHTPEAAELIVTIFYGGLHAVGIILGVATIILSIAMQGGIYGKFVFFLGLTAGVLDIVGAYPSVIGQILTLVFQTISAVWLIAVGWRLCRLTA